MDGREDKQAVANAGHEHDSVSREWETEDSYEDIEAETQNRNGEQIETAEVEQRPVISRRKLIQ
jgi:hypothetical protein